MSKPPCLRLLLAALLLAASGASSAATDHIFSSGFEAGDGPPPLAPSQLSFVNQTQQRVDGMTSGVVPYLFDAVWTDFNNDGCYDAFVFSHQSVKDGGPRESRLWINRCDGSHHFVYHDNAAVNYAIPDPTSANAAGWLTLLDANGDGTQDYWGWNASNQAAWFVNATPVDAHVPWFSHKLLACSDHCVFADIDGDNRLDIIHPDRSVEDLLTRTQIAAPVGLDGHVIVADVDGDGWPDILQPQLGGYWHNLYGQLQWRDSVFAGRPVQHVVADFNNDGTMDLMTFVEGDHDTGQIRLYRNDGDGQFVDVTQGSGLESVAYKPYWTSYGNSVAADLDNDGLPDLVIAGATRAPSVTVMQNIGNMHFVPAGVDLGAAGHGSQAFKSRASVADFDNDGRLDIIKTQDETSVGIWRNTTDTGNAHWMKVRVRGAGRNTDGVGTDLKWYRHGTSTLVAHMTVQVGEQHPQTWLHTGLGDNARIDLVVRYPTDGPTWRFDDLPANQEVIVYPNGCLIQHWQPGNGWPLTAPAGCGN